MALSVHSKFWYGHTITSENNLIDFQEGATVYQAELRFGSYSPTEFCAEISRAMTSVGSNTYSADLDRALRKITISADANFNLLANTGIGFDYSTLTLAGFSSASDKTGADTYLAESETGSEFSPQVWLQSYTPFEHWKEYQGSSISKSVSGNVESVHYGIIRKMECFLSIISEKSIGDGNFLKNDANALQNLINFLEYISTLGSIEFMENENFSSTFVKCRIESSPGYKEGDGFKVKELIDLKLPEFYSFGPMVFREVA